MTSPAVPPYSSTTMAMWNFSSCISRRRSETSLDSGMNLAGRMTSRTGSCRPARPLGAHEVLRVGDPDDVVDPVPLHRDAAVAGGQRPLERVVHGDVGLDRHHVGPRRHHLARHGVAEVDDGVDERALVALDHVLLVGDVGHGLQLGVGDVGVAHPLLVVAGTDDPVGQPDEDGGEPADGREADQRADDRRAHQRGPLGVLHRPVLGHRLEEHEDHHDFEHDAEEDAEAAEEVRGDDADQGGRDRAGRSARAAGSGSRSWPGSRPGGPAGAPRACARRPGTWP